MQVKFFSKRSIRHALEGLYLEARYKTRHKLESNISLHIKTKNLKKNTHTLKKICTLLAWLGLLLTRVVIAGNPDPEFPGFGVFFPIPIPGLYV